MNIQHTIARVEAYLAERFPLEKFNYASLVQKKEVPIHKLSWGYYLGGLALFFFLVQVVTGLMLLFYYEPTVSDAHASIEYLTDHVPGGGLVRNIHSWASSFMIACVMIHLLTALAMKAFGRPREITWLSGVLLLGITFAFGFTGYLLPWHQVAVNATKIGLQTIEGIGQYLPGAMAAWPKAIKEVIQGEASVGQATLSRFFALHVVILPLSVAVLLAFHLLSVQLHGMSPGVEGPPKRTEKFFPTFFLKDLSVWGVAFMTLFILGLGLPFESFHSYPLFAPFDAQSSTPDGIKPEWYFYWIYYPLELLPFWVILLGQLVLIIGLLGTPWIFKQSNRRTLGALAVGGAIYLLLFTAVGGAIFRMFKG